MKALALAFLMVWTGGVWAATPTPTPAPTQTPVPDANIVIFRTAAVYEGSLRPAFPDKLFGLGDAKYIYNMATLRALCIFYVPDSNLTAFLNVMAGVGLTRLAADDVSQWEFPEFLSALDGIKNPAPIVYPAP